MIEKIAGRLVRHALWVVAAVLVITASALSLLVDWENASLRLQIDPAIQSLLPAENAERQFLEYTELLFGRTESVVAAIYLPELFSDTHLQAITQATENVRALAGVNKVLSLASAPLLSAEQDSLSMDTVMASGGDAGELAAAVKSNPLYAGTLLSKQGDATAFVITLDGDYESAYGATAMVTRIREELQSAIPQAEIHLAGPPVLKGATGEALTRELSHIVPTIFGLIAVFLLIGFRSVRTLLLPLLTLAVSLIWVMGLIALTGRSLNLITAIVPPVVITIGLAYTLHVLSAYFHVQANNAEMNSKNSVKIALADVAVPLMMTAATTAAGFVALTLSPLTAIREFAWLSAAGVAFSVLLSITFLPAMLALSGSKRLAAPPGAYWFRRWAIRLGHFDVRHRKAILLAGGALLLVSILGIFNIKVGTNYVQGFAADAPVRADFERISSDFGGATPLSVVLQSSVVDTFAAPDMLAQVAALQEWLQAQPEIGTTTSVVDYLKVLNRALNEGEENYFSIPQSRSAVKQLLLFGSGDTLDALADSTFQNLQIQVRAQVSGSEEIGALAQRIEQQISQFPEPVTGRVTGTAVLVSNAVDEIAGGQIITIGAALTVVFLLLSGLFTSFRVGFLALLPNIIPIFLYFGMLGFVGVPLSPTTSLIACIVLGIAVDDTLYYLARFNTDAQRMASESKATVSALRTVIRPVTYSSAALVMGFLVLTFSSLQNQVQFGALAAFTIAVAWVADLTFTPALASGVRIVTLWDVLRLDLGREPQKTIPLFADLSLRQARVFALLSNVQRFKAGDRVMSEGDRAGDIYVVIDGELKAWVHREGEDVNLSSMRRGAVMGEVGHFAKRRTANVDAVSDVRLIRFDNQDMERLRRRSPRIAALVFRNLNRIQAQRLAQTTQMLR